MGAMPVKLTKTQQALLDAIKAGEIVLFCPSFANIAPCYLHTAPGKRPTKCTAPAAALLEKGLVERYADNKPRFGSFKLRIKEPTV